MAAPESTPPPELYRALLENLRQAVFLKDRSGVFTYVNECFCRMIGRLREDIIGRTDADLFPADLATKYRADDERVMASGEALATVEENPGPDGSERYVEVVKTPLRREGECVGLQGVFWDVTDRVESEKRLDEGESRLRLIAAASQDAIWDHDLRAGRIWRNAAFDKLFVDGEDATAGRWEWWTERIHPKDRERVVSSLVCDLETAGCARWNETYHFRGALGHHLYVQEHVSIERDDRGAVTRLVGTMRDLTPLQRSQEEKERVDQKLREAQKLESLGVLAGGIAHDFNNLLTSMLGNVNLAQLELPPTATVHPYLEDVEKAAIRAADLCKQMLAYSGRGRFVIKRVAVNAVVEEMMQLLRVSISKQAVLKFNLSSDLPVVTADPTQLRQIVMNLVVNASEAIGERSGLIGVTTGLMRVDEAYLRETYMSPELPAGDYVFIEVSDTGCGMDKPTMERIFDPFFTTKFTGRGLGLAAVLGIVRSHHGALKVYSEPGKGTTFKLLLPCSLNAEAPDAAGPGLLVRARGEGMVLVVDDEETVRATSARMLETAGYTVKLAEDGREGLELFEEHLEQVKLVLLDLTMPHMDGVDTFREMRRLKPDAHVLLMSGYNEQEAVQRFTGKGLAGFIQKPFQLQTLLTKVKTVIETPPRT